MATTSFSVDATQWVDLGPTPCSVQAARVGIVLIALAPSIPLSLSAAAHTLSSSDRAGEFTAPGMRVYARALTGSNSVVVSPIASGGGGGGGGGDASAANQATLISALGAAGANPPAMAGTGVIGWLRALGDKLGAVVLAAGTAVIGKVGLQVGGADVAAANPVPNAEVSVRGVIDMPAAATDYAAGRFVEIVTTTAGTVTLTYADGSTRTRTFSVGLTRLPDAVTRWDKPTAPASAFVGTLCNLK